VARTVREERLLDRNAEEESVRVTEGWMVTFARISDLIVMMRQVLALDMKRA
jgi:hypothetical protein